jgi:hypothetical protein
LRTNVKADADAAKDTIPAQAQDSQPPATASGGESVLTLAEITALFAKWQGVEDTEDDKFSASKLVLGDSSESDIRKSVGLDNNVLFGASMEDPVQAMKMEWHTHGTQADMDNWRYVVRGIGRDLEWVPQHVQDSFVSGVYHGGSLEASEFDTGHDGWTLEHFLELPASQKAGLKKEHVIALRLYSSSSFRLFNRGMRERTNPHPIRVTVYVLNEALKKLRVVAATENPEEYNKVKILRRGMKNMMLDFAQFARTGGTEVYLHTCVHVCVWTCMYESAYVYVRRCTHTYINTRAHCVCVPTRT